MVSYYLILSYYCIVFILQCVFIYKGKYENNGYFSIFESVFAAIIALSLPCCIYMYNTSTFINGNPDLGDAIVSIFRTIVIHIFFIVQFIIGLALEKPKNTIKKGAHAKAFLITILSFSLIFVLSIFILNLNNSTLNNNIKTDAIVYLNKKYGDYGFTVIDMNEEYSYNGIIDKFLSGYTITVNSSSINKSFEVTTGTEHEAFLDTFVYNYYESFLDSDENKEKNDNLLTSINTEIDNLEAYLNKYNKVSINRKESRFLDNKDIFNSDLIPNDYGRIPSIDELYDLAKNRILNYKLSMKNDEDLNKDVVNDVEREENLIAYYSEIAKHIIEYYPNINSFKIDSYPGCIIIDPQKIYVYTYSAASFYGSPYYGDKDWLPPADKIINR